MAMTRKRSDCEKAPIRLLVHGAAGRMGARVCDLARDDARFEFVAGVDINGPDAAPEPVRGRVDAVIDFSSDQGAAAAARIALDHGAALLVCTTGLSRQTLQALDVASRRVPVMTAANTSVGVAVLAEVAVLAARLLGEGFDVSLIEMHHVHKRDAPSGTALRLADDLRQRAGVELPPDRIHALRGGDVVGEHTIEFAMPGERLRFSHVATNRDLFARGALRAAAWLAGRPAGHYTIEQALGMGKTNQA